jgi:hypothetical protein
MAEISNRNIKWIDGVKTFVVLLEDPIVPLLIDEVAEYKKSIGDKNYEIFKRKGKIIYENYKKKMEEIQNNIADWKDKTKKTRDKHKSVGPELAEEYINIRGDNVENLEFVGNKTKFELICGQKCVFVKINKQGNFIAIKIAKCGHKSQVYWTNYFRDSGCDICASKMRARKLRLSIDKVKEIITKCGDELQSKIYLNNMQPLIIKCHQCKKNYVQLLESFTRKKPRKCGNCGINNRNKAFTLTNEKINEYTKNNELKIIGIYKNMHTRTKFQCLKCDWIFETTLDNIRGKGTGCPKCSGSFGERMISMYLDELIKSNDIESYKMEYIFKDESYPDLNKKRFDFLVIKEGNPYLIEYDGQQHFEPVRFGGMSEQDAENNLKACIERDGIKTMYCYLKYIPLLRINYNDSRHLEFYIKTFLNMEFEYSNIVLTRENDDLVNNVKKLIEDPDANHFIYIERPKINKTNIIKNVPKTKGEKIKNSITSANGNVKWTTETVKQYVESQGESVVDENFEYTGCYQKIKIKCKNGDKCKGSGTYELMWKFYTSRGSRCQKCSIGSDKRLTVDYVLSRLKEYGYELLDNEYKNSKTKLRLKCKNGHEIYKTYSDFSRGVSKCMQCVREGFIKRQ